MKIEPSGSSILVESAALITIVEISKNEDAIASRNFPEAIASFEIRRVDPVD
jgi:hypothetical protein